MRCDAMDGWMDARDANDEGRDLYSRLCFYDIRREMRFLYSLPVARVLSPTTRATRLGAPPADVST